MRLSVGLCTLRGVGAATPQRTRIARLTINQDVAVPNLQLRCQICRRALLIDSSAHVDCQISQEFSCNSIDRTRDRTIITEFAGLSRPDLCPPSNYDV
jgi:hypothetical protein